MLVRPGITQHCNVHTRTTARSHEGIFSPRGWWVGGGIPGLGRAVGGPCLESVPADELGYILGLAELL